MSISRLPTMHALRHLAVVEGSFPAKAGRVLAAGKKAWCDQNVIDFIRLFPADEVFISRNDFLERCAHLLFLLRAERRAPKEVLHSPQG